MEIIRNLQQFKSNTIIQIIPINLIMRKQRSFQQYQIQNFQIEQQFQKLMQIEGLSLNRQESDEPFPSIKSLFQLNTSVNIIGHGPNSNIRAFYYLLLCNLRKEHLKKLVNNQRQKEAEEFDQNENFRRDRKVSFNGKGAVFLDGPQYENFVLHKLRIYAFSSNTDLNCIQNSPFKNDSNFRFKGKVLQSSQLKRLLSQFLKELLPAQISQDYKTKIKSVRYYLNRHKVAGIILTMVMRFILFSNYQISSAQNFAEQVSDHTVFTSLCDAFAIDGLLCKDNLYQINNWCKIHSINIKKGRILFVEMANDEFEDLGLTNDAYNHQMKEKTIKKQQKQANEGESKISQKDILPSFYQNYTTAIQLQQSNSIMCADQDSQISYQRNSLAHQNNLNNEKSESSEEIANYQNDGFRQTFNCSNKKYVLANILQEVSLMQQEQDKTVIQKTNNDELNLQKQDDLLVDQILKVKTGVKEEQQLLNIKRSQTNKQISQQTQQNSIYKVLQADSKIWSKKETVNMDEGCTPPLFFHRLTTPSANIRTIRIGFKQDDQKGKIVNNNISNNIYVSLGNAHHTSVPVINISTNNSDAKYINIKLI